MQANKQTFSLEHLTPDLADADAGYNLAIVVVDRLDGGRYEQNMQTRSMMMHFLKTEHAQNCVYIRISVFQ